MAGRAGANSDAAESARAERFDAENDEASAGLTEHYGAVYGQQAAWDVVFWPIILSGVAAIVPLAMICA